ncbi:TonB system transport protein ExbD [Mesorhizobium sp. M2E.F.Ca.ET.209.01.1.1]|jgi:biopolymer transport protein ExbD|uniref:TonB system transport protein ExbD n=1 Tax=Mesorhizobium sp. M2E.F.Ca.ET.209.01.1.1 TaxID=2500526 RepID=UPI000FD7D3DB|nr:TonB system transport protein ExbD [Mesorhizobium sp. M2E.F.Ca.ET.209.01.1.1]TGS12344.1 TonB system transport protein ExbD [Mesorhizobium sp. M2E.F.Ca.ET.209.01.1.1]
MAARIRETAGDDLEESHDINVTPFIDVILVLLIIFMVAAPLATVDVNVDLPGSTATPAPRPETPLFLTLKSDLTLAIGNDSVPRPAFAGMLDSRTKGDRQTRIFLRADKTVGYGDLMEVMNLLRSAGYLKVALVGLEATGGGGQAAPGTPAAGASPAPTPGGSAAR